MNIFCVSDYFHPGFLGGGPITTLVNMRKQLRKYLTLSVFTRDRDLGSTAPYPGIKVNQWQETLDGPVYYASPNNFSVKGMRRALRDNDFDIIYFNSFFSASGSIFPLLALRRSHAELPVLIAPRGEFSRGALSIKRYKKRIYLEIARLLGSYNDVFWHASTSAEADDILCIFPDAAERVLIASDPVCNESFVCGPSGAQKEVGHLRLVFISRITPKKNLDGLLEILAAISFPVQLHIYGPIEDHVHWNHCLILMEKLPKNIEVRFLGTLSPDLVPRTFAKYDLFVFPTHGENFGHVIFESLRAGTPVLVSDQTPWREDSEGALSVIPLCDTLRWQRAIQKASLRSAEEHQKIRFAAQRYAKNYILEKNSRHEALELFVKVSKYRMHDEGKS